MNGDDKTEQSEDEPMTRGDRKQDPELLTIGRILRMLDELEDRSRARVVVYLSSRYAS